jgi:CcmD family protein
MRNVLKVLLLGLAMVVAAPAFAQEVEMADGMRAEGKIYVIVAIVLIVLVGLLGYLFLLDKKIKRIEDLLKDK